jgi:two-component system, OmpR family, sensor kinase
MPAMRAVVGAKLRSAGGLWSRTPLRVRLVATLLLLVIGALGGSGVAATATMRSYLLGRVDSQLRSVGENPITGVATADAGGRGREGDSPADSDSGRMRLPSAYVVEVADATGAIAIGPTSNLVNTAEQLPQLPRLTGAVTTSRTFTVASVSGNDRWRVLTEPVTLSSGGKGTLIVAQSLGDMENTLAHLTLLLVVIGSAAVLVLAGVGYLIVRVSLRPLRQVELTAARIADGDLSQRVALADPRTEIGQLSQALNTMLGEIETAFADRAASEEAARRSEEAARHSAEQLRVSETAARRSEDRMRRFIADASHELRTPLTSIRGFAELYRQGAASTEGDLQRLMTRVEDEAKRMGLLVEDLLMLARLDQQRPLAQAPVDVLALAADAVHDASVVDRCHRISLEVGRTDPPPIVIGDEARLRQVLGNLVGNALRHTPAGTAVTVSVGTGVNDRTGAAVVSIAVSDEGPGLSSEDAARVFERFYRAEKSRNRSDGGTGLGLAIVTALVSRHGGTVEVDTAPGAGACFRVELPLADVLAASH